ncbi:MAG: insulinase family protein [Clostridia bacterium]|nr:insulinase family protein [Clostridia bacterium]
MIIRETLPNGIRLAAQQMSSFRSVSMGIWAGAGSVYETEKEAGISHFIEHMVFKGTERRTAADIASEMDGIGGSLNAYTAKECTCFYAKVLGENMDLAADILSDMVCFPKLDEEDIGREKGVVCEEILMLEDDPEDLAHESLCRTIYGDTPLSSPILGTQETVQSFTREDILSYMDKRYIPSNMVISCAGNFDIEELRRVLTDKFCRRGAGDKPPMPKSALIAGRSFCPVEKDIEQMHICLGFPGFGSDEKGRFPLLVLNNALGGSMSSRLFQKIREEHGMAYSVYSYPTSYAETGYFTLYAGTGEKQAAKVTELMLEEIRNIRRNGITEAEFARSKQQLKGSYILGLESTSARSSSIGKGELMRGRVDTDEELIGLIEAVTMEDVAEAIQRVTDTSRMACSAVGRGRNMDKVRRVFEQA